MILLVCGTQKFQLNRMLEEMDRLVENGTVTQEVFAQIGHSDYRPKHYPWAQFVPGEEFEALISRCSLLLTHSGVGTILTGKEHGKPILVFPRSKQYGEHVDDHQWQIAREFASRGYVLVCESTEQLGEMIEACADYPFRPLAAGNNVQTDVIRDFLKGKQPAYK